MPPTGQRDATRRPHSRCCVQQAEDVMRAHHIRDARREATPLGRATDPVGQMNTFAARLIEIRAAAKTGKDIRNETEAPLDRVGAGRERKSRRPPSLEARAPPSSDQTRNGCCAGLSRLIRSCRVNAVDTRPGRADQGRAAGKFARLHARFPIRNTGLATTRRRHAPGCIAAIMETIIRMPADCPCRSVNYGNCLTSLRLRSHIWSVSPLAQARR
jgi:hypothetical protein